MTRISRLVCVSVIFLAGLALLVGCETLARGNFMQIYPGPALHNDLQASLEVSPTVRVLFVDGVEVRGFPLKTSFAVLPGKHTVVVAYCSVEQQGRVITTVKSQEALALAFEAEPGHLYSVGYLSFYSNGKDRYFKDYYQIATAGQDERAVACKDKLSILWTPEESDLQWYPYIYDAGHWRTGVPVTKRAKEMYAQPLQVNDKRVLETKDILSQETKELFTLQEEQKKRATECLKDLE